MLFNTAHIASNMFVSIANNTACHQHLSTQHIIQRQKGIHSNLPITEVYLCWVKICTYGFASLSPLVAFGENFSPKQNIRPLEYFVALQNFLLNPWKHNLNFKVTNLNSIKLVNAKLIVIIKFRACLNRTHNFDLNS